MTNAVITAQQGSTSAGTTAQRGTGATSGSLRFNTTTGFLETHNGTNWNSLAVLGDGSSFSSPAVSAAAIKTLTGTTTSGYYWILLNGNPTQVYCDMSGTTAWMLAMRINSNDTTLGYASSLWTNSSGLNDTGSITSAINIKNGALWGSYPVTGVRITGSTSATAFSSNPLVFSGFSGPTLVSMFNSGNSTYSGQFGVGRAAWLNWATSASGLVQSDLNTQPNCNIQGINAGAGLPGGSYCRIGISMNNEADCQSNDSWVGIGGSRSGAAGAASWTPATLYYCHAWLWIN